MNHRIQFTNQLLILVIREAISSHIIGPVKTTYFKRTVISAISCTDTTVISHLVDTFRTVIGSSHRTNILTRSIITMLTHHRLKYHTFQIIRIFFITYKVAVNTQPVHIMVAKYLTLTNNGHIVF